MVRIEPITEEPDGISEIWRLRQEFIKESGATGRELGSDVVTGVGALREPRGWCGWPR